MADIENWKEATFEEKYASMMAGMSVEDQRKSAQQVIHLCLCSRCPTYKEAEHEGLVFCTLGKSQSMHEKNGCLCSECSVTRTMSLRWEYYCLQGAATELAGIKRPEQ
ncbi:MAG: DUF2769 domain-containing protein [Candidatus Thorarchaeota archaeon]|nr:MAG: DUF2769 domain-containing protein [Candidatus Thorarchaeota archaeon]